MAGKSTYLEDKMLNWMKGTAFGAAPATVYVALFTTAPADDGTGAVEVSGGCYARAAITTSTGFTGITRGTAPHPSRNQSSEDTSEIPVTSYVSCPRRPAHAQY